MGSDSATHLATQQSIKKYVDDSIVDTGYADGTTYIEASNDTERQLPAALVIYQKMKEFSPINRNGTISLVFYAKRTSGSAFNIQVYLSGAAQTGKIAVITNESYGAATTIADIDVSAGDVIQLWGQNGSADVTCYIKEVDITCLNPTTPQEASGL